MIDANTREMPRGSGMPAESLRIDSLDGLRGIAAFAVLVFHACKMLQLFGPDGLYEMVPGVSAVIVFYVISGTVLSLSPLKYVGGGEGDTGKAVATEKQRTGYDWFGYYPKRVVRLCVPLAVAVALGVMAAFVADAAGLDPRVDKPIDWATGIEDVARQVLMQFDVLFNPTDGQSFTDGNRFVRANSPTWSMSWELWFSLALPFVVFIVSRTRRIRVGVCICILLVLFADLTGYFPLRFCVMFVVGAYIARKASRIVRWRMPVWLLAVLLLLSLGAVELSGYFISGGTVGDGVLSSGGEGQLLAAVSIALGDIACMCLVILVMARGFLNRFLSVRPVRFLGRISYSLYLTHVLVVGSLGPLLPRFGLSHPLAVAIVVILVSLGFAWVFWRFVEKPSIDWARSVGRR